MGYHKNNGISWNSGVSTLASMVNGNVWSSNDTDKIWEKLGQPPPVPDNRGVEIKERFLITDIIAKVPGGVVYLGIDLLQSITCAFKILFAGGLLVDTHKRFDRETHIFQILRHPRILPEIGSGKISGSHLFRAMKLADGGTFEDWIKGQKIPDPHQSLLLLMQVAEGLAYAHKNGIVHGDLSPRNILIHQEDCIWLSDWNSASFFKEKHFLESKSLATPLFMSPEHIFDQPIIPATDVFSFGLVLYFGLTGRHPLTGSLTSVEMYRSVIEGKLPELLDENAAIPEKLNLLFKACINPVPEKRPGNGTDLIILFENLMNDNQALFRQRPGMNHQTQSFTGHETLIN